MLDMMCALLGTPSERIWPALPTLPHFSTVQLPYQPYNHLKKVRNGQLAAGEAGLCVVHFGSEVEVECMRPLLCLTAAGPWPVCA